MGTAPLRVRSGSTTGTAPPRRLFMVEGNRFVYFANHYFGFLNIDLTKFRSVEFLPAGPE